MRRCSLHQKVQKGVWDCRPFFIAITVILLMTIGCYEYILRLDLLSLLAIHNTKPRLIASFNDKRFSLTLSVNKSYNIKRSPVVTQNDITCLSSDILKKCFHNNVDFDNYMFNNMK